MSKSVGLARAGVGDVDGVDVWALHVALGDLLVEVAERAAALGYAVEDVAIIGRDWRAGVTVAHDPVCRVVGHYGSGKARAGRLAHLRRLGVCDELVQEAEVQAQQAGLGVVANGGAGVGIEVEHGAEVSGGVGRAQGAVGGCPVEALP